MVNASQNGNKPSDLLTMEGVAVLMGTSRAGVQTLINNGELPALIENKPRRVMIPIGPIQKLVAEDIELQRKCRERLRALASAVGIEMPEESPFLRAADAACEAARQVNAAKQDAAEPLVDIIGAALLLAPQAESNE